MAAPSGNRAALALLLAACVPAPAAEPAFGAAPSARWEPASGALELELSGAVPEDPTALELWVVPVGAAAPASRTRLERGPRGPRAHLRTLRPDLEPGTDVVLAVADGDGHRFGAVRRTLGEPLDGPLRIELERTASLVLDVALEPGEAVPGELPRTPELRRSLAPLEVSDGAVGGPALAWRHAELRWLPAGSYELSLATRAHREVRREVSLEPGRATVVAESLELFTDARTVRGRIRAEDGGPLPAATVVARLRDRPWARWTAAWAPVGDAPEVDAFVSLEDGTGVFAFRDVPPGALELEVLGCPEPADATWEELPGGDARIDVTVLDGAGPGSGFRIAFAGGGEPGVARLFTRARDGGPALFERPRDDQTITRADLRERRLEWALVAPGRVPVYGTQEDFREAGGGRVLADVVLVPGFGTRVVATDAAGEPVEGARVEVDGELAGWTDAEGVLAIARETAAVVIEVVGLARTVSRRLAPADLPAPWIDVVLGDD